MKTVARFKVVAQLDKAGNQNGTVEINRATGVISVRPLHSRTEYALPLSEVASIIVAKVIKADVAAMRRAS